MPTDNILKPIHRPHAGDFGAKPFDAAAHITPILRVEGLIKIYGKRRVVDGVSFHVNHGEIVGLLGPNGAGKTTSFRMTCGLIDTNGGIVYLDGKDATNWPMYRRSREGGMGYLPQAESVFRNLSVQDNLLGVMEMLGMNRRVRKARCDELLEKFNLTHLRRKRGSGLSGGERRRLEIARALVSEPKIILLDEPFANIDPITVHSIQEIIRQLAVEGISILITDHQVRETLQITQRSYVIRSGQVLCHGTPEEVLNNEEARKVYFGNDVTIGGSSIILPPSRNEMPPSINEDDEETHTPLPDTPSRLTRPRPRPHQKQAMNYRDEEKAEKVAARKTEPHPSRPITRSVTPITSASSSPPVRPPSRPAVRSVTTTPTAAEESKPAASPTESGVMKKINVFLWGSKK